ncbi:arsenate reductase [Dokdonia sp. Hel_I_63]|jgi:arsenate reductase|uniref:arsenate reductase (glutaredoxin) n=1 Tax=unclassified Dokdonia TaxID=2615033 RepID=UPI00020A7ACD|nr:MULTISPECIES: arsenate reductase (glutaredoxin) [unclassified Dokdonia]AEE20437.1 arsenate reductase [Dokdonia sp. 4H-3-7-5]TVZ23307.1 arsenate reductase [Dokdonia sp. Hel_I_63]
MIKIYHNPRCSKSRQGLALLEESGKEFEVIKYLDNPLSESALTSLIDMLDIAPMELVRKGEAIWKENYKGKELSDTDVVAAMSQHPKLIERPIVVLGKKAVIGRPLENIEKLLSL